MLVSANSPMGPSSYPHTLGGAGDIMNDVAAKARVLSHTNPFLVKRSLRLRQHAALKSLRISSQTSDDSGLHRESMFSPHSEKMAFSTTMAPIQFLPGPDTLRPLEVDTDTETTTGTGIGTDSDEPLCDGPKTSSRMPCFLIDLSNYLDASHDEGKADMEINRTDRPPLTEKRSCDTDSYGWESEFDRQLDCGRTDSTRCRRIGYRRT